MSNWIGQSLSEERSLELERESVISRLCKLTNRLKEHGTVLADNVQSDLEKTYKMSGLQEDGMLHQFMTSRCISSLSFLVKRQADYTQKLLNIADPANDSGQLEMPPALQEQMNSIESNIQVNVFSSKHQQPFTCFMQELTQDVQSILNQAALPLISRYCRPVRTSSRA